MRTCRKYHESTVWRQARNISVVTKVINRKPSRLKQTSASGVTASWKTINMPPTFCTEKQTFDPALSYIASRRLSTYRQIVHIFLWEEKKPSTRQNHSHKDNPLHKRQEQESATSLNQNRAYIHTKLVAALCSGVEALPDVRCNILTSRVTNGVEPVSQIAEGGL